MGRTATNTDWLDRVSEDIDLRKRHEDSQVDVIVRRAVWLDKPDCELVLAMFRDGRSATALSDLVGTPPRSLRRHIKQLVQRLNDPCVAYVVAHQAQWSRSKRAIARSIYIQGRSMRETADELGISFYSVRKHRESIEAMCESVTNQNSLRAWRSTNSSL